MSVSFFRGGCCGAAVILQHVQHSGKSSVQGQQQWLIHGDSLGEHKVILGPSFWPLGVSFFLADTAAAMHFLNTSFLIIALGGCPEMTQPLLDHGHGLVSQPALFSCFRYSAL